MQGYPANAKFTTVTISSGGKLIFVSTDKSYFEWVDPDTLVLKVLGDTAHTWTGDFVPPTPPDYAGVPMGIGIAITYPE